MFISRGQGDSPDPVTQGDTDVEIEAKHLVSLIGRVDGTGRTLWGSECVCGWESDDWQDTKEQARADFDAHHQDPNDEISELARNSQVVRAAFGGKVHFRSNAADFVSPLCRPYGGSGRTHYFVSSGPVTCRACIAATEHRA
jgi:hypothetical protein